MTLDFRNDWPIMLIMLAVAAILGLIVADAVNTASHGGCAERVPTGATTCTGGEGYLHCTPDMRCVRYGDGTKP